jgi:glycosyltransferase involved in cell wall biosynthesis
MQQASYRLWPPAVEGCAMNKQARTVALIVAPDGPSGGGMGRVKDYIVESPHEMWDGLVPTALVTRGDGGKLSSLKLLSGALSTIRRRWRDDSLALVHVNMGDRGSALRKGLIVLRARALGVPVFLHLHAVELEHQVAKRPWLGRLLALPFRRATAVIVLGERYRKWVVETLGVDSDRVEILWNGVPVDVPASRRHEQGSEPRVILFLGTLGERKGAHDLIAALGRMSPAAGEWRIHFAGPGDLDRFRAEAAAAGIADRVEFLGWLGQAEAREALAAADMMVLPSYDEGLPLVILEALGLGTPVICTPVGVIPEVLTDGTNALFCKPGNREGLAQAIERLLGDAALRQRLCDNGLARYRELFSIEAFRGNLLAIWRRHTGRL